MKKLKGSVSLFAAMIFLLLVTLILTTIESARIQGSKVMVATALSMGLDSIFADFDEELFSEFGVLLLQEKEGDKNVSKDYLAAKLGEYMSYNIDVEKNLFIKNNTDLYGIELMGVSIGATVDPLDEGGLIWQDMVVDYEKYAKVINLAADYLGMHEQTEEAKAVDEICTQLMVVSDKIMVVNTGTRAMIRYIDGVWCYEDGMDINAPVATGHFFKQFCPFEKNMENVNIAYSGIYNAACNYMTNPLDYIDAAISENKEGKSCDGSINSLKELVNSCKMALDSALVIFEEVEYSQLTIDDEIAVLDQLITEKDAVLEEGTKEGIMEEYEAISNYSEILVQDICDIEAMGKSLRKDVTVFNEILNKISFLDYSKTTAEIENDLNEIKGIIQEFTLDAVCFNYSKLVYADGDTGVLDEISGSLEEQFLQLMIPKDATLSNRGITENDLASSECDTSKAVDVQSNGNPGTTLAKRMIYTEYVMDKFNSFTDQKEGAAINYEVEYVLYGNKSDMDNLTAAIFSIATIRSGTNMVYLLTDSDKRSAAYNVASTLVGTAKIEPLIRAIQFTLMYLWAYAEALMDVRILLEGKEIAIAKSDETWQLTLPKLLSMELDGDAPEQKGINYENFLRFLMYLADDGKKSAHTMDLVELSMSKKRGEKFRLKNYIYGMEATVAYSVGGKYYYTEKAVYSY